MIRWLGVLVGLMVATAAQAQDADPYARLRDAYAQADPALAASAYAETAVYAELYAGAPPVLRSGRAEIQAGFGAVLEALGFGAELEFRFARREEAADVGVYRLRHRTEAGWVTSYGRFFTHREAGLFTTDVSTDATEADFEALEGTAGRPAD